MKEALNNGALIAIIKMKLLIRLTAIFRIRNNELFMNAILIIHNKRPRIQSYMDIISLYDNDKFKSNFR